MSDSESSEDRVQPLQEILTRTSQHTSNGVHIRREKSPNQLSAKFRTLSNQDVESRYRTEEADNRIQPSHGLHDHSFRGAASKSIVSWEPNDEENPYNWSDVCTRR